MFVHFLKKCRFPEFKACCCISVVPQSPFGQILKKNSYINNSTIRIVYFWIDILIIRKIVRLMPSKMSALH